jgi:antitoxin (DNA-binding transcriptional repressor) of toxin-antitoxin stability system
MRTKLTPTLLRNPREAKPASLLYGDQQLFRQLVDGIKELRDNMEEIVKRAQAGESFTVVRHSKPAFTITPPQAGGEELNQWLDEYIAKNRQLLEALAGR